MFRILVEKSSNRFMEGWEKGQIVAMDDISAAAPLKEGAIEMVEESVVSDSPVGVNQDPAGATEPQPTVKKARRGSTKATK